MNLFRRIFSNTSEDESQSSSSTTSDGTETKQRPDRMTSEADTSVPDSAPSSKTESDSSKTNQVTNTGKTSDQSTNAVSKPDDQDSSEANEDSGNTKSENDTRPIDTGAGDEAVDLPVASNDGVTTNNVQKEDAAPVYADGVTRPLSSDQMTMFEPHSGHLIFGQSSDQGMVRTNNQDAAMSFFFTGNSVDDHPDFGVFIVADGMGGHHDGEKASAMAARVVVSEIMQKIYLPMLLNDTANNADQLTIAELLNATVKHANTEIRQEIQSDAGTTVTAMVVVGDMAHIAHVGDTRAYLITEHEIEKLTRDHSLVTRLIELGQINEEEAANHDQKNVLYRAVGQNDDVEVDTYSRRLPAASYVLICSDGLWGSMRDEELVDIITSTPEPQEACDKLVALANTYGGHDNITAILLKMPGH